MQTKILEEKENPLFNRKEIKIEIESEVTPSHAEVKKLIAEEFKTDADKIKINKIESKFGVRKFIIYTSIYNSKEDKENFEIKTKKQRETEKKARLEEEKQLAEEKKKSAEESAKVEEKPAESIEEPKEEPAPEENKEEEKTE